MEKTNRLISKKEKNMRTMTLKEIQQVNLEMMIDIHSFCVKNGIRYSLAYGSLIGAVRHKGFIPWDDDIDIMMPRPDFEKFSSTYQSQHGYILSSVYDEDTYINYTRVYDNRTLVISKALASKHDVGVWIDVYPVDGISDDEVVSKEQFKRLKQYTSIVMKWRNCLFIIKQRGIYKKKMRALLRMTRIWLLHKGSISLWHQKICNICKEYEFGETERCSILVCVAANSQNKQEVFQTKDFFTYQLVPFESEQFYIVTAYDHILTTIFGDYMKIPPKDKQISHIIHQWKFFWTK